MNFFPVAEVKTPLLDQISSTYDLRKLDESQLPQLCDELRRDVISCVSKTGGHLGAGLGVVELTVALHYVFDTPKDRLLWDVGHQAYPHKILTGRRHQMASLRQKGGCLALPSALSQNMIHLVRGILLPRYLLVWGWR